MASLETPRWVSQAARTKSILAWITASGSDASASPTSTIARSACPPSHAISAAREPPCATRFVAAHRRGAFERRGGGRAPAPRRGSIRGALELLGDVLVGGDRREGAVPHAQVLVGVLDQDRCQRVVNASTVGRRGARIDGQADGGMGNVTRFETSTNRPRAASSSASSPSPMTWSAAAIVLSSPSGVAAARRRAVWDDAGSVRTRPR